MTSGVAAFDRGPRRRGGFLADVWRLTIPYFRSEERWSAFGLLGLLVALTLFSVYLQVEFNDWYGKFFDDLQQYDLPACVHELWRFCWLAAIYIANAVVRLYVNLWLRIRWRAWTTARLIERYLDRQAYYRLQLGEARADNPDQRIADDVQGFTDNTLVISLNIFDALITLFSFVFILWRMSGALSFSVAGLEIAIPAYLVWVAIVYSALGTWITTIVGAPLVRLNFVQQIVEANFRFSLIRVREQAEGVALYHGEAEEGARFGRLFQEVVANWRQLMTSRKNLTLWTAFYGQAAVVIPILAAMPKYFAKEIQFGGFNQIINVFQQVQGSLSILVDSYTNIAAWRAITDRLITFLDAIDVVRERADAGSGVSVERVDEGLAVLGLTLALPNGRVLGKAFDFAMPAGSSLLVTGPSGSGKSTLLRTLAGIWPYASGTVRLPKDMRPLFLPQRPYLPQGTLRGVLAYPSPAGAFDDAAIAEALRLARVERLIPRLDETALWSQDLSPGEQQRIAFARAFLQRPNWLFLDEATAALDEDTEAALYRLAKERLPGVGIVSVGHRSTLADFHDRRLDLGAALGPGAG